MTLTDRETQILEFEDAHTGGHLGRKELAIFDDLHLRPARYYQLLNRLLDNPDALAAYPALVTRLRRIRDASRAELRRRHGHH